jgi:phosphatidylinositol alpha-1,6-mannosyltransferase
MRVLFLTDSLSDLDGVGRYAVSLIQALEELRPGLEVDILLARKHRPTSSAVPAHWKVRVALPPDYFFYMSPLRFWTSFCRAVVEVRAHARRADVVHAIKDYPHSYAAVTGARMAKKPCVATAHGTYSVQPLLDPRHSKWARGTFSRLAAVIAVSGYTKRRLLASIAPLDLDPSRVHVVPNAVGGPIADVVPEPDVSKGPYTLAIGEVKERKGHHLSLAAFCRVARRDPALRHVIVGKATGDAYHQSLVAMARDAGVADRVEWRGNVSEAEKHDLLRGALAFVHTPVTSADGGFEGFGIVYLEASAQGVPAIGTRDSGAEDAIDDGVTGLLVEKDAAAVAGAIERLRADPALRRRLGEGGLARARRSTWTANARSVLAIYDAALAEASATRATASARRAK